MSLEDKKKKKKKSQGTFFLQRTDLTFYLELFKLPQNAKKFKRICKHVDNWLEPVRYQYCPDSLPGSLYSTSCHPSSRSCASIPQQTILSHRSTFIHCCKPQISKWEVRVEFMMTLHFLIFLLLVYQGSCVWFVSNLFSPIGTRRSIFLKLHFDHFNSYSRIHMTTHCR